MGKEGPNASFPALHIDRHNQEARTFEKKKEEGNLYFKSYKRKLIMNYYIVFKETQFKFKWF